MNRKPILHFMVREYPWRFDYPNQGIGPKNSSMSRTDIPDVFIKRSLWNRDGKKLTQTLKMQTEESFADYGISLWGLPETIDPDAEIITNAKEQYLGKIRTESIILYSSSIWNRTW